MVHSSRRSSSGAHPATYASLRCLRASLGLVICHSHPPLFPSLFFCIRLFRCATTTPPFIRRPVKTAPFVFYINVGTGPFSVNVGTGPFRLTLALGLLGFTLTVYTVECLVVWGLALLIAAAAGRDAFLKVCFFNTTKLLRDYFVGEISSLNFEVKGVTIGDFCLRKDSLKVGLRALGLRVRSTYNQS